MNKRRIPSPRVMAATLIKSALEGPYFRSAGELTELFDTKVSDAKREKVIAQVEILSKKFEARLKKIIDNFEKPPPRKPKEKK